MSVFDVASYILRTRGPMSAMKLQKLVYYSQAWSLVWDERPLFDEQIQAWANGPVVVDLYAKHKGVFMVDEAIIGGNADALLDEQKATVDAVLEAYGSKTAQWLSDLSHLEEPWLQARKRKDAELGEKCSEVITHADMHEYYSSILQS